MSARPRRVTSRTRPPKRGTPQYEWWLAELRATYDSLRAKFWQWCLGMRTAGLLAELPEGEKSLGTGRAAGKPFDFRFLRARLFVEIDGLSYDGSPSGHQTATGYERDRVKDNEAVCAGWRVLRLTGSMLESGTGYLYVERALGIHRRTTDTIIRGEGEATGNGRASVARRRAGRRPVERDAGGRDGSSGGGHRGGAGRRGGDQSAA